MRARPHVVRANTTKYRLIIFQLGVLALGFIIVVRVGQLVDRKLLACLTLGAISLAQLTDAVLTHPLSGE